MRKHYVNCKISPGFFKGEFYVILETSSAFVSEESVRFEHAPGETEVVDGQVLAYLVAEEQDKALVQLPGEAAVGGLRSWVPKSTLTAA